MPRFDGTGPQGKGSLTGRGQGKCKKKKTDNSENSELGSQRRGLALGRRQQMRGGNNNLSST